VSGTPKLPEDAFAFYVALGTDRSYDAVAAHFQVNRRTVVRGAARDRWAERLEAIEQTTRALNDAKLAGEIHEMHMQHNKLLKAMASRVASALQSYQLTSAMEGLRGAEIVIKLQRTIAGEPAEKTSVSVERVTRGELARFLTTDAEDDWSRFEGKPDNPAGDDGEEGAAAADGQG